MDSYIDRHGVGLLLTQRPARNDVLEAWFNEHYSTLTSVAHLMLGDRAEAEEVVIGRYW